MPYFIYIEKDRDHEKRFYHPKIKVLRPVVRDLQDLSDGKLAKLAISMSPGTGKSTLRIFYITWLMGKEPLKSSLVTTYAGKLTRSFFDRVLQIIKDSEYKFSEVFPDLPLIATTSLQLFKHYEITMKEYK